MSYKARECGEVAGATRNVGRIEGKGLSHCRGVKEAVNIKLEFQCSICAASM